MGLSLRIFLVKDDDSLQRLTLTRYERLLRRDPEERLPQYAGKRLRYALVVLELANRKPVEVIQIQYAFLPFDFEGRLDAARREREASLALETLPPVSSEISSPRLIDARHRFAKKRYDKEYRWKPSPEMEAAIMETIFGRHRR